MSTVKSIPWMPEKAWTTCRSKAAISGLFRSGFSPEHVQVDPPCQGPDTSCVPPYLSIFSSMNITMEPDGDVRISIEMMLVENGGPHPLPVYWELYLESAGDGTEPEGGDYAAGPGGSPIDVGLVLNCLDFGYDPNWIATVVAWGDDPTLPGNEGIECFTSAESTWVVTDPNGYCG